MLGNILVGLGALAVVVAASFLYAINAKGGRP